MKRVAVSFALVVALVVLVPGLAVVKDGGTTTAVAVVRTIRVGLACAHKPTIGVAVVGGVGGAGRATGAAGAAGQPLVVNGTELAAPVRFELDSRPEAGGSVLACHGADATVVRTSMPATVTVGGSGTQSRLLWLDNPASVYRGEFLICLRAGGSGLAIVNVVDLEDYVAGVVPYEIGASSPPEALRVQAVIARTEAVNAGRRHAADAFDICNTTHCQVYLGAAREIATPAVREAVDATAGEVLWYGGRPAPDSNYFACCGGYTESSLALWKSDVVYMRTIACRPSSNGAARTLDSPRDEAMVRKAILNPDASDYCYGSNGYRWTYTVTASALAASVSSVIGVRPANITGIEVLERTPRGAAVKVAIVTPGRRHEIAGELAIRMALGGSVAVKSGVFVVDAVPAGGEGKPPAEFRLSGAGYGHGVGLCQYGARKMATLGVGYRDIISHYYPGVTVGRLESPEQEDAGAPDAEREPARLEEPVTVEEPATPEAPAAQESPEADEVPEAQGDPAAQEEAATGEPPQGDEHTSTEVP
jgi:SpoIID/LytB domain protein